MPSADAPLPDDDRANEEDFPQEQGGFAPDKGDVSVIRQADDGHGLKPTEAAHRALAGISPDGIDHDGSWSPDQRRAIADLLFTTDLDLDDLEQKVRSVEPGPTVPLSTNTVLALIDLARAADK